MIPAKTSREQRRSASPMARHTRHWHDTHRHDTHRCDDLKIGGSHSNRRNAVGQENGYGIQRVTCGVQQDVLIWNLRGAKDTTQPLQRVTGQSQHGVAELHTHAPQKERMAVLRSHFRRFHGLQRPRERTCIGFRTFLGFRFWLEPLQLNTPVVLKTFVDC
jgi:hypothetical protein